MTGEENVSMGKNAEVETNDVVDSSEIAERRRNVKHSTKREVRQAVMAEAGLRVRHGQPENGSSFSAWTRVAVAVDWLAEEGTGSGVKGDCTEEMSGSLQHFGFGSVGYHSTRRPQRKLGK
ncbi:hypothetical protein ERJ75_000295600 [Trypanosoma vivax]|nr:hypothetical protein ERJ75_000295600 [Trypanosoma vivax]